MTNIFWLIIGIGLWLPSMIILIANIILSLISAENYKLDLSKLGIMYLIMLLGIAITFGIRM